MMLSAMEGALHGPGEGGASPLHAPKCFPPPCTQLSQLGEQDKPVQSPWKEPPGMALDQRFHWAHLFATLVGKWRLGVVSGGRDTGAPTHQQVFIFLLQLVDGRFFSLEVRQEAWFPSSVILSPPPPQKPSTAPMHSASASFRGPRRHQNPLSCCVLTPSPHGKCPVTA